MEPQITFQPIEILSYSEDHEGCLVLADGKLAAVLIRLADAAYEPPLPGSWYLEAGFGALEIRHDLFASLEEAAQVLAADLARASDKWPPK